jgi:hypothetical protein
VFVLRSLSLLRTFLDFAKRVDHAIQVHSVIEKLKEGYTSWGHPENSKELLRGLLHLYKEEFRDSDISSLSKLFECFHARDGWYMWASDDEIKGMGEFVARHKDTTPPTVSASVLRTAADTVSSKLHMKLLIKSETEFGWWESWVMLCHWVIRDVNNPNPVVARGMIEHSITGKPPQWTDDITIEDVPSLEKLRDCELHVCIDRPSGYLLLSKKYVLRWRI